MRERVCKGFPGCTPLFRLIRMTMTIFPAHVLQVADAHAYNGRMSRTAPPNTSDHYRSGRTEHACSPASWPLLAASDSIYQPVTANLMTRPAELAQWPKALRAPLAFSAPT